MSDLSQGGSNELGAEVVTHEQLMSYLPILWASGVATMILGEPGVGKTALAKWLAKWVANKTGKACHYIDPNMFCRDPIDFTGVPLVMDGHIKWYRPEYLGPSLEDGKDVYAVLNLDELPGAAELLQKIGGGLMLERRAGSHQLHPNTYVMATGNMPKHKAGASHLLSQVRSRGAIFELRHTAAGFIKWAAENNCEPEIITFAKTRPEWLQKFDADARSYPCLRAWGDNVNKVLRAAKQANMLPDHAMLTSMVGGPAALEFEVTMKYHQRLDIDGILASPTTAKIPDKSDIGLMYAMVSALSARANKGNIRQVIKFIERLNVELAVFVIKNALRYSPNIKEDKQYIQWCVDNDKFIRVHGNE